MSNFNHLFLGIFLFFVGQSLIWIQTNGQFVWKWVDKNPLLMSIGLGIPISYMFIKATRLVVDHFDGSLWPSRFIGFALGIMTFTFLTWYFKGEFITWKTGTCLMLAASIITIQIFWKS